jgi:hypothetical protein
MKSSKLNRRDFVKSSVARAMAATSLVGVNQSARYDSEAKIEDGTK